MSLLKHDYRLERLRIRNAHRKTGSRKEKRIENVPSASMRAEETRGKPVRRRRSPWRSRVSMAGFQAVHFFLHDALLGAKNRFRTIPVVRAALQNGRPCVTNSEARQFSHYTHTVTSTRKHIKKCSAAFPHTTGKWYHRLVQLYPCFSEDFQVALVWCQEHRHKASRHFVLRQWARLEAFSGFQCTDETAHSRLHQRSIIVRCHDVSDISGWCHEHLCACKRRLATVTCER